LKTLAVAWGSATLLPAVWAQASGGGLRPLCTGRLDLYNIHTGETYHGAYLRESGELDPEARQGLERFFRCHHTGQVHPIDPDLFLLLDALRTRLEARRHTYRLVSGFRSREYNRLLRQSSDNVAKRSYHVRGKAADVKLEGVPLGRLAREAHRLRAGGVGRYRFFVHLDVGPVRFW
jgi:uncharacterized protein YcbK (DUF882 family)